MAAAATLGSTTLENQLHEVLELMSRKQVSTTDNPDGITTVTAYSRNNLTGILTATVQLRTTDTVDAATGSNVVVAEEVYL